MTCSVAAYHQRVPYCTAEVILTTNSVSCQIKIWYQTHAVEISTNRHIWIAFGVPVVVDPDNKEYPPQQPAEAATRYVEEVLAKSFLVLIPPKQIQQPPEGKLTRLHGLPIYQNVIPYEVRD